MDEIANEAAMRAFRRIEARTAAETAVVTAAALRILVRNVAREWLREEARAHGEGPPPDPDRCVSVRARIERVTDEHLKRLAPRDRRIMSALRDGRTEREVAEMVGVSASTVHRTAARITHLMFGSHFKAKPLPRRNDEWAAAVLALPGVVLNERHRTLLHLRAAGATMRQIGTATGLTRGAVRQHLIRLERRYPRTLHGATIIM